MSCTLRREAKQENTLMILPVSSRGAAVTLSSSCVQPLVSSGQPGDTKDEDYLVGSGILNESAVFRVSVAVIIVNIFNMDIWGGDGL